MQNPVTILAIESSCDDTSAAVMVNERVISNIVANQEVHVQYGGVVPELASRSHQANIVPVVDEALRTAKIQKNTLDAVAFTQGPGLLGSLLVGSTFAKGLALGLDKPLIAVNHMEAHILAHFIDGSNVVENMGKPEFPFLCLTVSGGHTQLVLVKSHLEFEVLGETLDDAAGEAFDKGAKLLGLEYPGGPLIDQLAETGNPEAFRFAAPRIEGYNFSFSGLKTSLLYFLQAELKKDKNFITHHLHDLAASYRRVIIRTLTEKLVYTAKKLDIPRVALAGGVSANRLLRREMIRIAGEKNWKIFIPQLAYCTDNAAMIGIAAYYKYQAGIFAGQDTTAQARMHL